MQKITKLLDSFERSPYSFWLCLAALFFTVLAFHGKPVPFNNEFIYLLRLEPGFLPNDWSFSQSANEHWLFNALFSLPARVLPIEVVGWTGRIVFWALCLAGFLKLGKRWDISYFATTISIAIWLAFGQSVVNAEWIFGGFEAKPVAYACLIFALVEFSKGKITVPSILLGFSFSFHPAVGLWAIPAVGIALLVERLSFSELAKVTAITFVACLPGIIPMMTGQASAQTAAAEDWQFIVTTHMPFHFDPYYFSKIGIAVLAVMLVFNIVALRNAETFALRFFRNFQIAIAAFFVLGVLFRSFELYSLLGYMPMRLFPILTPLFFLFAAFYLASRHDSIAKKLAICVVLFGTMSFVHPFDEAIGQLRETKAEWIAKPDDAEASLDWLQKNVPKDATILSSPVGRKFWYLSHRAQIVSYAYPRYEKLAEWRRRIADLTANVEIKTRESSRSDIEGAFSKLSADQIIELQRKYAATYLLSRTVYPFPVIFETETYKVYRLP